MKKSKLFLATLLAGTMALSAFAMTACNDKPEEKPEEKPETTETKLTDGVFSCVGQGTREIVVKFYEDGTYFAQGMMGTNGEIFRGSYVVHNDVGVQYVDYGSDGNFDGTDSTTVLTSTASIEFKDEAGNASKNIVRQTLTTKPDGVGADYVLPQFSNTTTENFIAYADDTLQMCKVGGYGRALKHNPTRAFTKDDEPAVLEKTFMVTEDNEKIEGIVTQQMLTIELYDKKFVDKVSASVDIEGKLSKSGNVYTLTYSDGTASLTVSEDGKTAVWKKGDTTINYVIYADAVPVAAQLEGAMKMASGNAAGNVKIILLEDGTYKVDSGSMKFNGTYTAEDGNITFEDFNTFYTINSATYATAEGKATVTVNLTATHPQAGTLTGEIKGEVTGTLYSENPVVAELTSDKPTMPVSLTLYADGKVTGSMRTSSGTLPLAGTYVLNGNEITLDLGEGLPFTVESVTYADGKVTVAIKVAVYNMTANVAGDVTGTLFAVKLAKTGTASVGGNDLGISVTFYNNGKVNISVSAARLSVTGKYTASRTTGLVVTDIGEMTLTQSVLNLVVGGTASVGGRSAPISATITCTQTELGALLA